MKLKGIFLVIALSSVQFAPCSKSDSNGDGDGDSSSAGSNGDGDSSGSGGHKGSGKGSGGSDTSMAGGPSSMAGAPSTGSGGSKGDGQCVDDGSDPLNGCTDNKCFPFPITKARLPLLKSDGTVPPL